MSRWKKIRRILLASFVTVAALEAALRVALAFHIGPDVLFYGTPFHASGVVTREGKKWRDFVRTKHSVADHENTAGAYSKYFPRQKRLDTDKAGRVFDVGINNEGFRGRDFEAEKQRGVMRIACLGASSTFGYGNRDDETYPYYLEEILSARLAAPGFKDFKAAQVMNFGIPHLDSSQIYSLFLNEVVPLKPDVVTFYEGMNDASELPFEGAAGGFTKRVSKRLLLAKLAVALSERRDAFGGADYIRYSGIISASFIKNLSLINEACSRRGIKFYAITQQAKSPALCGGGIRGVSFSGEAGLIRAKLERGPVSRGELYFLIQSDLMERMRSWAKENNIRLIDGIAALDRDRGNLTSWVHLKPEGNRLLAAAIAGTILEDAENPGHK